MQIFWEYIVPFRLAFNMYRRYATGVRYHPLPAQLTLLQHDGDVVGQVPRGVVREGQAARHVPQPAAGLHQRVVLRVLDLPAHHIEGITICTSEQ